MRTLVVLALVILAFGLAKAPIHAASKGNAETEQALIKLENEFANAYVKDIAAAERIMADDYIFITPDGEIRTKADEIGDLKSGKLKVIALTAGEMKVRVYGKAAVVIGIYELKGTFDGKDISGRFRFTDVFVHEKNEWRIVSTHASKPAATK
jgi:ketosteroid isomerase-like protein